MVSQITELSQREIRELNSLRFVAALYVFLFHIQIRWPLGEPNSPFGAFLNQGATAMTLFFMLSGYVLMSRYSTQKKLNLAVFTANRIARIYPVYLLTLLITLPWMLPGDIDGVLQLPQTLRAALAAILILVIALLLLQAWLTPLFSFWNFGGSWSISVEAFLSLAFVQIHRQLSGASLNKLKYFAGGLYFCSILPGATIAIFANSGGGKIAQFYSMPIFRLSEFALGCLAATLASKINFSNLKHLIFSTAGPILLCIYLMRFGYVLPEYITHNWIVVPVIFGFLISINKKSIFSPLLRSAIMNYLGKVSYSFYSIQLLLILVLIQYHEVLINLWPQLKNPLVLTICAFILLLASASACYHFFENPIRKLLRAHLLRSWKVEQN